MKIIKTRDGSYAVRALRWDALFAFLSCGDPYQYLSRSGSWWCPNMRSSSGETMAYEFARFSTREDAERMLAKRQRAPKRLEPVE